LGKPIEILGFGGINRRHDRQPGQPSGGKNFRTRGPALFSRSGTVSVTAPDPCAAIKSLHAAAKVSVDTRLLMEEGNNLWHKTTGAWSLLKSDLNGTRLNSCRWQDYLLMGNGNQALAYDITNRTIADIGGSPPPMQHLVWWKYRPWVWAPDYTDPHLLSFPGYDVDGNISKDVWPVTYKLNIGGSAGLPILGCVPYKTHMVSFTRNFFKRVMGNDETDLAVLDGTDTGLLSPRLATLVDKILFWVGSNEKVYLYTGSDPIPISDPIKELLDTEDFSNAFSLNLNNQYWLFFPLVTTTRVYIFDPGESGWYIDEYPAVITAGYIHGAYNSAESIYFGTSAGTMCKVDDSATTDFTEAAITTDVYLGPLDAGGAEFWANTLHVQADPKNNFNLDIYASCDRRPEQGPFPAYFSVGSQSYRDISLRQVRGKNVSLRISSTDKINELQKLTLSVDTPWGVK
jgi:hypothetical protein